MEQGQTRLSGGLLAKPHVRREKGIRGKMEREKDRERMRYIEGGGGRQRRHKDIDEEKAKGSR